MTKTDTLISQYSGKNAVQYEKERQSPRWQREVEVFEDILSKLESTRIVDCPVGTCRWAFQYAKGNFEVFGLDLSVDMLAQAAQKAEAASLNFTPIQIDILETKCCTMIPAVDLVICIRFINWLPLPAVETAIRNLSLSGANSMILGVSMTSENWSLTRRLFNSFKLWRQNIKRKGGKLAPIYVHPQRDIERIIYEAGWEVKSKEFIFDDGQRTNFFYLLQRV